MTRRPPPPRTGRLNRRERVERLSIEELERRLAAAQPDSHVGPAPHAGVAEDARAESAFFKFAELEPEAALSSDDQGQLLRAATLHREVAFPAWRDLEARGVPLRRLDGMLRRLPPPVYANLRDGEVGQDALTAAKATYVQAWTLNRRLLDDARDVLEGLRSMGIEFLILKGAAMVPLYYRSDWGRRWMADVDLWVRQSNLARATEVLEREGWEPAAPLQRLEPISHILHAGTFRKTGVGAIDLHSHPMLPCCWPQSDSEFWDASVPVGLDGVPARALCPTDQLFHACVNAEVLEVYHDKPSIYWAADAMAILDKTAGEIDWGRLVALAIDRRLVGAVSTRFTFIREHLEAPIPQEVIAELGRVAPSLAERIERFSVERSDPRERRLLNLVSRFLRLRRLPDFQPIVAGPLRFLKETWNLDRTWQVAPMMMRRLLFNLRTLARARLAREGGLDRSEADGRDG